MSEYIENIIDNANSTLDTIKGYCWSNPASALLCTGGVSLGSLYLFRRSRLYQQNMLLFKTLAACAALGTTYAGYKKCQPYIKQILKAKALLENSNNNRLALPTEHFSNINSTNVQSWIVTLDSLRVILNEIFQTDSLMKIIKTIYMYQNQLQLNKNYNASLVIFNHWRIQTISKHVSGIVLSSIIRIYNGISVAITFRYSLLDNRLISQSTRNQYEDDVFNTLHRKYTLYHEYIEQNKKPNAHVSPIMSIQAPTPLTQNELQQYTSLLKRNSAQEGQLLHQIFSRAVTDVLNLMYQTTLTVLFPVVSQIATAHVMNLHVPLCQNDLQTFFSNIVFTSTGTAPRCNTSKDSVPSSVLPDSQPQVLTENQVDQIWSCFKTSLDKQQIQCKEQMLDDSYWIAMNMTSDDMVLLIESACIQTFTTLLQPSDWFIRLQTPTPAAIASASVPAYVSSSQPSSISSQPSALTEEDENELDETLNSVEYKILPITDYLLGYGYSSYINATLREDNTKSNGFSLLLSRELLQLHHSAYSMIVKQLIDKSFDILPAHMLHVTYNEQLHYIKTTLLPQNTHYNNLIAHMKQLEQSMLSLQQTQLETMISETQEKNDNKNINDITTSDVTNITTSTLEDSTPSLQIPSLPPIDFNQIPIIGYKPITPLTPQVVPFTSFEYDLIHGGASHYTKSQPKSKFSQTSSEFSSPLSSPFVSSASTTHTSTESLHQEKIIHQQHTSQNKLLPLLSHLLLPIGPLLHSALKRLPELPDQQLYISADAIGCFDPQDPRYVGHQKKDENDNSLQSFLMGEGSNPMDSLLNAANDPLESLSSSISSNASSSSSSSSHFTQYHCREIYCRRVLQVIGELHSMIFTTEQLPCLNKPQIDSTLSPSTQINDQNISDGSCFSQETLLQPSTDIKISQSDLATQNTTTKSSTSLITTTTNYIGSLFSIFTPATSLSSRSQPQLATISSQALLDGTWAINNADRFDLHLHPWHYPPRLSQNYAQVVTNDAHIKCIPQSEKEFKLQKFYTGINSLPYYSETLYDKSFNQRDALVSTISQCIPSYPSDDTLSSQTEPLSSSADCEEQNHTISNDIQFGQELLHILYDANYSLPRLEYTLQMYPILDEMWKDAKVLLSHTRSLLTSYDTENDTTTNNKTNDNDLNISKVNKAATVSCLLPKLNTTQSELDSIINNYVQSAIAAKNAQSSSSSSSSSSNSKPDITTEIINTSTSSQQVQTTNMLTLVKRVSYIFDKVLPSLDESKKYAEQAQLLCSRSSNNNNSMNARQTAQVNLSAIPDSYAFALAVTYHHRKYVLDLIIKTIAAQCGAEKQQDLQDSFLSLLDGFTNDSGDDSESSSSLLKSLLGIPDMPQQSSASATTGTTTTKNKKKSLKPPTQSKSSNDIIAQQQQQQQQPKDAKLSSFGPSVNKIADTAALEFDALGPINLNEPSTSFTKPSSSGQSHLHQQPNILSPASSMDGEENMHVPPSPDMNQDDAQLLQLLASLMGNGQPGPNLLQQPQPTPKKKAKKQTSSTTTTPAKTKKTTKKDTDATVSASTTPNKTRKAK